MGESLKNKITRSLPLVLAVSIILPMSSFAGFFGDHTHYQNALSEIRSARALVQANSQPAELADEQNAVRELQLSIEEITQASKDDWQPMATQHRVDGNLNKDERFHEALRLLARAHNNICRGNDGHCAQGLRNEAVAHLDQAMNFIRLAMNNKHFNEPISVARN
jgi:hypothetical protein